MKSAMWKWHRYVCRECDSIVVSNQCGCDDPLEWTQRGGLREDTVHTVGMLPPDGAGWSLVPGQVPSGKVAW